MDEGRDAVQSLSRYARSATRNADHVQDRLHTFLRQLDAAGRCRAGGGYGKAAHQVHAGAAEHENGSSRVASRIEIAGASVFWTATTESLRFAACR
jgi:hypothetical protein